MQIFGQSLRNLADAYLHAGYCSAPPAPNEFVQGYPTLHSASDTGYAVSLDEAFRLVDTADAAAAIGGGPDVAAVVGSMGIAAVLAGALWLRLPAWGVTRWRRWAPAAVAGLVVLCAWWSFPGCDPASEGPAPPWEGVEIREYADPWAALNATAHALVADGAMAYYIDTGSDDGDLDLVAIQDHVQLPLSDPTEGQEYALVTYGLDAWGHEMELVRGEHGSSLTSAGPDGTWDTGDDLSLPLDITDRWMFDHWAYYLVRRDDTLWLMTRREPDRDPHDGVEGCPGAFPDGDLFDGVALTLANLEAMGEAGPPDWQDIDWAPRLAAIDAFYETFVTPEAPEPVVMQVWGSVASAG